MDFDADVEELAGEEVDLVRGEDTSKGRAGAESLECLCSNECEVTKESKEDGRGR